MNAAAGVIDDGRERSIVLAVTMAAIAIDGAAEPATGGVISPMVASFGGAASLATFVTVGFAVAYDLSILCSLWLIDNHGKRGYFRGSLFGYATACVACALAPSDGVLVFARIAQGACLGGLFASALLTMVGISPAQRLPYVFAIFTLVALGAPEIAPWLSAVVAHAFGWRGVFAALAVLPLVAAVVAGSLMKDINAPTPRQFDTASFVAAGIFLLGFFAELEHANAVNAGACVAALAWFLLRELRLARAPFVDLRPFRSAVIARGLAGCALLGVVLGSSASLVVYLMRSLHLAPTAATALTACAFAGAALGTALLLRIWLGAMVSNKLVTIAGLLLLAGAYVLQAAGSRAAAGPLLFAIAVIIGGIALALTIGALASLLFDAVPHEQFGALALLFKLALLLGGALASVLAALAGNDTTQWFVTAAMAIAIAGIVWIIPDAPRATSTSST